MSVGIDVVDVARLRETLTRSPEVEERLFSHAERSYCHAKATPFVHLAGTLAAKEAVMKALGLTPMVTWARRIEIVRDASGAPYARVEAVGRRVDLSITHDGGVAMAVAIAGSTNSVAPPPADPFDDAHPENDFAALGPWFDKIGGTFDLENA